MQQTNLAPKLIKLVHRCLSFVSGLAAEF